MAPGGTDSMRAPVTDTHAGSGPQESGGFWTTASHTLLCVVIHTSGSSRDFQRAVLVLYWQRASIDIHERCGSDAEPVTGYILYHPADKRLS